jgi:hypothetical protein
MYHFKEIKTRCTRKKNISISQDDEQLKCPKSRGSQVCLNGLEDRKKFCK